MTDSIRIELHCHSVFSDGYYTVEELAERLVARGVKIASLTDHDTIEGLPAFQRALERRGIGCVSGVEISADFAGVERHFLAYGFDPENQELKLLLKKIRSRRKQISQTVIGRLDRVNPMLRSWSGCNSRGDADSPISAAQVIDVTHAAGGRVFLAHPMFMYEDKASFRQSLLELKKMGLDGLEAFYQAYDDSTRKDLAALAHELDLIVSSGSDYHGNETSGSIRLGMDISVETWKNFRDSLAGAGVSRDTATDIHTPTPSAHYVSWGRASLKIVLPTVLAIGLFIWANFAVVIPKFENQLMERKREMIRELINSACSVLDEYYKEEQRGVLSRDEAQARALASIRSMRYGSEGKDYFWITDLHPRMLMHPYRRDLDGRDVSEFEDPNGVRLFIEFSRVARESGQGYVEYVWQWKDNPDRLAPKESYVKLFEPWGWIIGTGIYLEDVRAEIGKLTANLVNISFVISLVAVLMLVYVAQQSIRIERKRRLAEQELAESHERYAALVAASGEGTIMVVDGRCSYHNRIIEDMLGYTPREFSLLDLSDILPRDGDGADAATVLDDLPEKPSASISFDTRLRRKEGGFVEVLLSATHIAFAGKTGLILNAKDISGHKATAARLNESLAKYRSLADSINLGVFKMDMEENGRLVEANPAARRILGIGAGDSLREVNLLEFFHDQEARESFLDIVGSDNRVADRIVQLRKDDGTVPIVSISGVLVTGSERYFEGVMEDITERKRRESERDSLIAELQAGLLFLNQPIRRSSREMLTSDVSTPLRNVARLMKQSGQNAVLVVSGQDSVIGIVTDRDFAQRVISEDLDPDTQVHRIMSAPVVSIREGAPAYEAILLMQDKGLSHLAVMDASGNMVSVIQDKELMQFQRYSSAMFSLEIQRADSLDTLIACRNRLPSMVKALIDCGARTRHVTRIITAVSDAVVEKLVSFAVQELGPPPCPFAFVALGSEGRQEQTLVTDQDNAIIYDDVDPDRTEDVGSYFQRLGVAVCDGMHQAGYAFCKADMMARNPKWCRPLSDWKEYFREWINTDDPRDFLDINIFFDFRCVAGERGLTADLRSHIDELTRNRAAFFHHFAQTVLLYKPPIGLFGKIVVKQGRDSHGSLDIKDAMTPIVNFARLYALRDRVDETNTVSRLQRLYERETLTRSAYQEISAAYDYLLQIRFRNQASAISEQRPADNYVDLKTLTQIEETTLKQTLNQVVAIQKKIGFDFGTDIV